MLLPSHFHFELIFQSPAGVLLVSVTCTIKEIVSSCLLFAFHLGLDMAPLLLSGTLTGRLLGQHPPTVTRTITHHPRQRHALGAPHPGSCHSHFYCGIF